MGFELRVGLHNQLSNTLLRDDVRDGPQKGKAPALTVHRILAGRERDVPSIAGPALPDAEANQLQPFQGTLVK